jgi:hypothetical protein
METLCHLLGVTVLFVTKGALHPRVAYMRNFS